MKFSCGLPETACGAGSRVSYTSGLREWLSLLLWELKIDTLLDAPCGDFNWMAHTDLTGVRYIGIDYDMEHLKAADRESVPKKFSPLSKTLIYADLVTDTLPRADMVLCREFFQHLPNSLVAAVIRNFVLSGSSWLLATSHNNVVNKNIAGPGGFRPLNLMAPPFSFPSPHRSIEDAPGSGRILGLWTMGDCCVA